MKILFLALLLAFLSINVFADEWIFKGDNYIVKTDRLGEINSLIIDGEEFLGSTYFFYTPFEKRISKEGNKWILKTDDGTATIEFLPDRIELVAENISAENYFIEFDPFVKCIKDNAIKEMPFTNEKGPHIVYRNDAVLECTGDFKLWGPWNGTLALDYFFSYYYDRKAITVKETLIPRKATEKEYAIIHSKDTVKN